MAGISHHMTGWGGGGQAGRSAATYTHRALLDLAFTGKTPPVLCTSHGHIICAYICLCMYYAICLVICNMQTKGGNGGRGERVQHSSVGSMLACCTAGPSSNPGSALQGGFSC